MNQPSAEHIPAATAPAPKRKNIFARLYQGELSLPVTFWGFGVLGVIVLACILTMVILIIFWAQQFSAPLAHFIATQGEAAECAIVDLVSIVMFPYDVVMLVGAWRAAERYKGRRIWALLVQISSVFVAVSIVYQIPEAIMEIMSHYLRA